MVRVDLRWLGGSDQDMVAKKADHSVLRLLQISQQHIESQLERVKHEREPPFCKRLHSWAASNNFRALCWLRHA